MADLGLFTGKKRKKKKGESWALCCPQLSIDYYQFYDKTDMLVGELGW